MSSSEIYVDGVPSSHIPEEKQEVSDLELITTSISIPDWSSSSFNLQLEASFTSKPSTSPPQTVEDMVLQFEESGKEIEDIFTKFDTVEIIPEDGCEIIYTVISESQIKTSRTRRSDASHDDDESIVAIPPKKMHSTAIADSSDALAEPLCIASPVAANIDVTTSDEIPEGKDLEANLSSNLETEEAEETDDSLLKRLAKVAHSLSSSESETVGKATATIHKLRQQSYDLMSTYTQLKNENKKFVQTCKQLQSEQPALTIEVLVPPSNSSKKSPYLYGCFPVDEESIPFREETDVSELEVRMDDSYENFCDVLNDSDTRLPLPLTNDCPKGRNTCRFGCVCNSLQTGRGAATVQCRNPDCMLQPECTRPGESSHRSHIYRPIMAGRQPGNRSVLIILEDDDPIALQSSNRPTCSKKRDKKNSVGLDDPKLKRKCFVRLENLNLDPNATYIVGPSKMKRHKPKRTMPKRARVNNKKVKVKCDQNALVSFSVDPDDWKLKAKLSVCLKRISVKPGCSFYCMEHEKRGCSCLLFKH